MRTAFLAAFLFLAACGPGEAPDAAEQTSAVSRLELTADATYVARGATAQLHAIGHYRDGSERAADAEVEWSSSDERVAMVSAQGLFRGVSPGEAVLTARLGEIRGMQQVAVTSAGLMSLMITPAYTGIPAGMSQSFVAIGTYSDGTIEDASAHVQWSSSSAAATVNPRAPNLFDGAAEGAAAIEARIGDLVATAALEVTPAVVVDLEVVAPATTIAAGTPAQLQAWTRDSKGTRRDVALEVAWSSNDPTVASISNDGNATGWRDGAATFTARYGEQTASVSLMIRGVAVPAPSIASPQSLLAQP